MYNTQISHIVDGIKKAYPSNSTGIDPKQPVIPYVFSMCDDASFSAFLNTLVSPIGKFLFVGRATMNLFNLSPGTKMVFTDLDGRITLIQNGDELRMVTVDVQIAFGSKSIPDNAYAVTLEGYLIKYA